MPVLRPQIEPMWLRCGMRWRRARSAERPPEPPAAVRLRARGYQPTGGDSPAGLVEGLAEVLVVRGTRTAAWLIRPGYPVPSTEDLLDALRLAAADPDVREQHEFGLVRAARAGAIGRPAATWTQIAAALGEDLVVVAGRYPRMLGTDGMGPRGSDEHAAVRAAAAPDPLPPTIGRLSIP